jgi:hypothetical protein
VDGMYVYFWTNENDEPVHFHIAQGKPTPNATKIWIPQNNSFRLENNNSKVPANVLRHILAVMQVSIEEYKEYWLTYHHEIHYHEPR